MYSMESLMDFIALHDFNVLVVVIVAFFGAWIYADHQQNKP